MGCLKLTYDYQEQGEKNYSFKWQVWKNPNTDFLEVDEVEAQGNGPAGDCPRCSYWEQVYDGMKNGLEKGFNSIVNTYSKLGNKLVKSVPHVITYDASISGVFSKGGGSYTFTMNYITRGQYSGFYPTTTFLNLTGAEFAVGLNVGYLYYYGNGDLNPNSLTGSTRVFSAGDGVFGINANFGYTSFGAPTYKPILGGNSGGLGIQLGGSWGTGETWSGWSLGK